MSIRGTVTLECDTKRCHGALDIEAHEWADLIVQKHWGLDIAVAANGWRVDENGDLICPQCVEDDEQRSDAHERAAGTGNRSWSRPPVRRREVETTDAI